ncbi:DUF2256 domain-containing protein [Mycolicibacterium murale]|nr:DUF2256 domain-containing protein [Mycolicibacterium murale]
MRRPAPTRRAPLQPPERPSAPSCLARWDTYSAPPVGTRPSGTAEEKQLGKDTETKICAACGRPFHNRKKWRSRGQWDQILYCSRRCRGAAR